MSKGQSMRQQMHYIFQLQIKTISANAVLHLLEVYVRETEEKADV